MVSKSLRLGWDGDGRRLIDNRYLIDSIELSPSPPRGPHDISPAPVNENANADALALYDYLSSVYGENVLSGQQDISMVNWVEENVGVAPAILGVDLMGV